MAVTKFIEAGTAATQDFTFWDFTSSDTGGSISSDPQAILGSVRSAKCDGGATPGGALIGQNHAVLADAGRRISFGFRFTGTINIGGGATVGSEFFGVSTSTIGTDLFRIGMNNSKNLLILKDGSNAFATGTAVLSASTDYRLLVVYTVTDSTHNSITLKAFDSTNTLLDTLTATNVTLANTGSSTFYFGCFAHNTLGANVAVYSAHWYIDDGTSGDPGFVHVTAKRPISNGTSVQFTTQIGSGGSGVGSGHTPQVNERPLSTTNGWSLSNTTKSTEEYNIESVSAGDVDITGATIVDYTGWIYSVVNSTANSPVHHIIVNNVATSITESTSNTLFTQIAGSSTYPAGTGTDIGIDAQYTTTPHLTSLFEAGIMVAYTPAAALASSFGTQRLLTGMGT